MTNLFFTVCSILLIQINAHQNCPNCTLEIGCTPRATCQNPRSTSLRILFDAARNIHIFCKEFGTYSTEINPIFDVNTMKSLNHPLGLNLPIMINKCYNSRPKHVKYHFQHLSKDPINISGNTFAKTNNMEVLKLISLNENTFLSLKDSFLTNLTNLKHLTLEKTNLNKTDINFKGISGLTSLKIVLNQIKEITPNSFNNLSNLETLELYENGINTIHSEAFSGLKNLKILDLTRNNLKNLSEMTFTELSELISLDISNNHIESIPKNMFKDLHQLEFLDMTNNPEFKLNYSIFIRLSNLKYLNLSYCQITEIAKDTFKGAENLEYINLSYNQITKIHSDSFSNLLNLQYLNISGNKIQTFDLEIFEKIKSLNLLDIAFNKIKIIERFPNNSNLEILNLRANEIESIPILSAKHEKLKSLDIGFNILKGSLKLVRDYPKSGVFFMNLIRNRYTNIDWHEPDYNISSYQGTTSIDFRENHLSCDCKKHIIEKCFRFPECPQSDWMQLDINREQIDCLWNIYPDNAPAYPVSCPIINVYGTPKDCEFYFKENKKDNLEPSFVIDCSFKNLTKLPDLKNLKFAETRFAKEINLLLNENKLRSFLKKDMDIGYQRVTHLNLSYNFIETLDGIPGNVKVVDLSNNKLENLGDKVLQDFTTNNNLNKILLNKNPWKCDCDSQNLKEYLINNTNLKVNKSEVYCESTGTDLVLSQICGENKLKIVLPVLLAVIFALISVLMALYYRYRTHIKVWLFSKNLLMWWVASEDFDKDKSYDVFISYSYKDEDFIQNELLPDLEKPERYFKVCVHYRDWPPGEYISKQITKSVLDSRRTLVVLSNNFMESVWGKMEFRTAHTQAISENKIRVIVVIYGELDEKNLDEEMKAYLKTNTYIKWGDPWFWNKLRYALPHSRMHREQDADIAAGNAGGFVCCNWFIRSTNVHLNHTQNINMKPVPET